MISEKEKEKIRKGIEAYSEMQADIIKTIKKHGGRLTQDEFDDEYYGNKRPLSMMPISGHSFILSIHGQQQEYLQIARYMMALDIIDAETIDGRVVYSINENTNS